MSEKQPENVHLIFSSSIQKKLLETDLSNFEVILVDAAENAKNKASKTQLTPEQRLDSLISTISKQIRDGERRELMRKIENREVSADEEADLLQQLIDQEREDQGLT